jgi:hypothetical protein
MFGLRTSHSTCLLKQFLLVSLVIRRVSIGGTELYPVSRFAAAIADVSSGRRPSKESRVDSCLYWIPRIASGSHGRNTNFTFIE